MNFFYQFQEFSIELLFVFAITYFIAGFIDAVVGGGGLLTVPTLLITLPNEALATMFGTNKIAALSGASVAASQYAKRIKFDFKLLFAIAIVAFLASFCGAKIVSQIDSKQLKPYILLIIIVIAVYTFFKKDLGFAVSKNLNPTKKLFYGCLIGIVVGFYDGFFGPGAGSFFVLGFVVLMGFDFLHASAYSKLINCVTNISALFVFVSHGNYIFSLAILMAIFNILGNILGTKMALQRGNGFVRKLFLVVLSIMILRYGYDVLAVTLPQNSAIK